MELGGKKQLIGCVIYFFDEIFRISFGFDREICLKSIKKKRERSHITSVYIQGVFDALAILYRAAVIYIGSTPAPLTPTISKQ